MVADADSSITETEVVAPTESIEPYLRLLESLR